MRRVKRYARCDGMKVNDQELDLKARKSQMFTKLTRLPVPVRESYPLRGRSDPRGGSDPAPLSILENPTSMHSVYECA
jgi:hypothetical protein